MPRHSDKEIESGERKLSAVLFADIKGYTALMEEDEKAALDTLQRFTDTLKANETSFKGKIIQFLGDGCLMTFDSSYEAVLFAKTVQTIFLQKPEVPVRIGIHNGEILLKDGNVYGDTVNQASRIESIGIAGSVLFSGDVYKQIRNKKDFQCKSLGKFDFKNVREPMHVVALANTGFQVPLREDVEGKLKDSHPAISKRRRVWVLGAIVASMLLLFAFLGPSIWGEKPSVDPASWLGFWEQRMEGEKAILLPGTIEFSKQGNEIKGTQTIRYHNSQLTSTNNLSSILLSESGAIMKGSWASEMKNLSGTFELQMKPSLKEFSGFYKMAGGEKKFKLTGRLKGN